MPARIRYEITADKAKVVDELRKVRQEVDKLKETNRKLGRSGKATNKSWTDSLAKVALAYIGVEQGVRLVTTALREMREERQRGANEIRASEFPMAQLAQVAGGDRGEMQRLIAESTRSAQETGMTRSEGAQLQFQLKSLGLSKDRALIASLYGIVPDPAEIAKGAGTLQAALGRDETGDTRAVINKLFAASARSKTTVQEFAPAAAIAAQEAKLARATDEEYLAGLSVLSKGTKEPDIAATQIGSFLTATAKKFGMTTPGILPRVREVQAMGIPDEGLFKALGRKEAMRGYVLLRDKAEEIETLKRELSEVGAAPEGVDYLARMRDTRLDIPELAQAQRTRKAQTALRETERETFGITGLKLEETSAQLRQGAIEGGASFPQRFLRNRVVGAAELTGSPEAMRAADRAASVQWQFIKNNPYLNPLGIFHSAYRAGEWGYDRILDAAGVTEPEAPPPRDNMRGRRPEPVVVTADEAPPPRDDMRERRPQPVVVTEDRRPPKPERLTTE